MGDKFSRQSIINIILIILLIIVIGYVAMDKYSDARQAERVNLYQQGARAGYEQAVVKIMQEAVTCKAVPITYQNSTLNLIATGCLQQPKAPVTT